ncbi:myosin-binding protein 2-like [Olea europaea var. sylvestris]|uniref:myosin-binding protein 2-like n=1 Tax=Olea europaea var. sylvestris TaxID=158386 RepID=UPI000C1CF6F2|nr:myosin-binding protein 2-like [Olea europaea var. sylvestris]
MAANKIASILHRNTNKITYILIYAVLEWILMVLLLLNSLFSYVIIKFAEYFGLKPPCLWCTRLDHIFEPQRVNKNMHRDLLCEAHSKEISKLGYCSNHQKLAESRDMCEDCLSSRSEFQGVLKNVNLFEWMNKLGMIQSDEEKENGEVSLNCSCCGVVLDNKDRYSSYILLKPSWNVFESGHKEKLIKEPGVYDIKLSDFAVDSCYDEQGLENKNESQILSENDRGLSVTIKDSEENDSVSLSMNELKELRGGENENVEENPSKIMEDKSVQVFVDEDPSVEVSNQHLEFFLDYSGHKLVSVELIDWVKGEDQKNDNFKGYSFSDNEESTLDSDVKLGVGNRSVLVEDDAELDFDLNEEPAFSLLDSMDMEEDENSRVFHTKESHFEMDVLKDDANFHASQTSFKDVDEFEVKEAIEEGNEHSDILTVSEEVTQIPINETETETEAEVSIGTEIPDLDIIDEIQNQEAIPSYECTHEDPSVSSTVFVEVDDHGAMLQEQTVELPALLVTDSDHVMNNRPSFSLELNEIEEDKVPDTPTSVESLHHLHKKLLLLEKRDCGTEGSLDGSVTSELEGSEGVVTVESLKSALRTERKALQTLYTELEEERSASAVAANQTMAMINRLQEEKAAMQMEALQYQRMMEEQSEYDQEALQLLNELMVKREKEKQELEKEFELYRKKMFDYETKEKMKLLKRSKDGSTRSGFSSASCSNLEDSDGLSADLNQEVKDEESFHSHQEYGDHNTPVNAVLNLEESLADFEEERLSILEELKVLEEKLMILDDEEEQKFEDVRAMEDAHKENGNRLDENGHFSEDNGHANGFSNEMMGKHHSRTKILGSTGKSLLPLFDAINDENGDVILNGNCNEYDCNGKENSYETKFEFENKKLAIEEEVDHLYERLQALEADREFLKHCISSLKKGDKGMDLLQEILQHLRDLRNVELRVRNLSDSDIL